ncbi:MFS transporter [Candidatus Poriferisodalis sp.]|uniref:MFS transporter n=1 Tax=Candidatus Poriferisodalis sp. TaxID=3101277 RepID=UPI003B52FB1D
MSQTTTTAAPVVAPDLGEPTLLFSGPFLVLNISAFFSAVSFSALLPMISRLVTEQTGGGDLAVGFAISVFAVTAIAARPTIGSLGDRKGRRFLVVTGCFLTALITFGHIWANTYAAILAMRLLIGAFQGAFFVGSAAMVSDLAPEHRRGEALNWFSVSIYLGMALGPWMGEATKDWGDSSLSFDGFDTAFIAAGVLMMAAAVVGLWLPRDMPGALAGSVPSGSGAAANGIPQARLGHLQNRLAQAARPLVFELVDGRNGGSSQPAGDAVEAPPDSRNVGRIFYKPALWPGIILAMGIIIFPALQGFLPKLAIERDLGDIGPVFAVYGLLVLVLRVLGRKLPDTMGTKRTATIALIGASAGMAVMGTFVTPLGLYVGVVIMALGGSLLYPSLMLAAVDGVPPNERARAVSTFTMFFELSAGIGGPILGITAAVVGATVGAFYASAALSALGIVLLWIWQRGLAANP